MFGLFGKKSDHPLADIKSAQQLLDDLPKNDAMKALQELTSWIEAMRDHAEFQLDHEAAVLRMFDETARPLERKLVRDYFAASSLPPFQESRLWMALNEFYTQLAKAYLLIVARYRYGEKGSSAIKPALALVSARGIRALADRLKCATARYMLIDQAIWKDLAEFYLQAGELQYADDAVQLYSSSPATTTVRNEFAGVLTWYATSASTLNRFHLYLAERLSINLCKHMTLGMHCGPDCLFGFDLQDPKPPQRAIKEIAQHPGLLFIGVAGVNTHIDQLQKELEQNKVPDDLNLDGLFDAGVVRNVLSHLAKNLAVPPPMRRANRHKLSVSLNIANGFSNIMEHSDMGLNFGNGPSTTWEVEDISTGGFRCIVPSTSAATLAIGSLIGLRPEKLEHWGVGIVRRMSRDQQENLVVGVEILSNRVAGVGLSEQKSKIEQRALWLSGPEDGKEEARLLMSPDTFSTNRSLHVRFENKDYLLMPLSLLEKGDDFDLARYRKIEEDTVPG